MAKVAYISGPMTGLEDNNYPAFHNAAAILRKSGLLILNPAENYGGVIVDGIEWRKYYMKVDIYHVLQSELLVVLGRWFESKGARTEVQVAFETGIPVYSFNSGYRILPFDLTSVTKFHKQISKGAICDRSDHRLWTPTGILDGERKG